MKIKIAILLLISLVSVSILHGQFFSVSDIETGRLNDLRPADLRSIQWRGTKPVIVFSNNDSLLEYNILEERKNLLLTPGMMNRILRPDSGKEITKIPPFYFVSEDIFLIKKEGIGYLIDLKTGDLKDFDFPEDAEDWVISRSDRIAIAYTLAGNIYVIDQDGQTSQVTSDTVDGISNGDLVYRNEFGITHGMAWSPDGARLVYYRRDETAVEQYPIVDITFPMARIAPVRYPMAGREMEKTDVWVYSASDQSSIMLGIAPDAGVYHTNLTWSHGGDRIYIQHLNRGQDTMKLRSYSATTGEFIEEYLTETHPKYIEPLFHVVPLKTKPGGFLYLSEKSGYNHLYECLPGKKVPKQLTEGNWEITEISGIDDTEKFVYFMATKDDPLERHLYRLDLGTREIVRLTEDPGMHSVVLSSDKRYFIDTYTSLSIPRDISVRDNQGKHVKTLLIAENPVGNFTFGQTSIGKIKAADGKSDLYYKLTMPVDADTTTKYPVIVYVYGGPHLQLINNRWLDRVDFLQQYYAQHGIASFMLDCRGSDGRGREFENCIHRQQGVPQMEDQLEGIKFLSSLSWIDTARIGIQGWSYGGFMTIGLMLNYPTIFKVGVAGGPVTDWKYYEVMYSERYMDTPSENPEGYARTELNDRAADLQGKLLVIHGALDDVVVWQNSLQFIQKCIESGRQVDYFVYPEHKHNVRGRDREHLTTMITQYFINNL